MKPIKIALIAGTLMALLAMGCKNEPTTVTAPKTSETELVAEITKEVDSLYAVYERFDYDWMEFYDDHFTSIYPGTPIQHMTKEALKEQWKEMYEVFDVQLLDRGRPTIIPSEDMAISYNSFHEIFINRETQDTIQNKGTYIVNWKRQADDSWKIVFETVQVHD